MSKHKGYSCFELNGSFAVEWTDWNGIRRRRQGIRTRRMAESYGAKMAEQASLVKLGAVSREQATQNAAAERDILDIADEYRQGILHAGRTEKHARLYRKRIETVCGLGGIERLCDVAPAKVQAGLAAYMQQGASLQTANHALTAMQCLMNWCRENKMVAANPIESMKHYRVTEKRHERLPWGPDDVAKLISKTEARPSQSKRFNETDRGKFYLLAYRTGLRFNELKTLEKSSFKLDGDNPHVVVKAAYSKHREEDRQPLPKLLVPELREWLAGKPDGRVFDVPSGFRYIFKKDCKRAGLPYGKQADGKHLDFHSLRHGFVTGTFNRTGNFKVVQTLARHKSPTTTAKYGTPSVEDIRKAVD